MLKLRIKRKTNIGQHNAISTGIYHDSILIKNNSAVDNIAIEERKRLRIEHIRYHQVKNLMTVKFGILFLKDIKTCNLQLYIQLWFLCYFVKFFNVKHRGKKLKKK